MQGLITRFDQLTIFGKPYNTEDQVEFVIDGIPEDYKNVADQIENKDNSFSHKDSWEAAQPWSKTIIRSLQQTIHPISENIATHRGSNTNNN